MNNNNTKLQKFIVGITYIANKCPEADIDAEHDEIYIGPPNKLTALFKDDYLKLDELGFRKEDFCGLMYFT